MKLHQLVQTYMKDWRKPQRVPLAVVFLAGVVCGCILYGIFSIAAVRDTVRSSPTGEYVSDIDVVKPVFYMSEDGKSGVWQLQNIGWDNVSVGGMLVPTESEHTYKLQLKDGSDYGVAYFTPGNTLFDSLGVQVLTPYLDRTFKKVSFTTMFQSKGSGEDSPVRYTLAQNMNEARDILGIKA